MQGKRDPRVDIGGENKASSRFDDSALVEAEIRRMKNIGDRHDRKTRDYVGDGVDRNIKMKIPLLKGRSNLRHIFGGENVKLVNVEFTDFAIILLDQIATSRRRNHEWPIETYGDLKAIMRKRFVSNHYYRDLYQKLQSFYQRSRSVKDYQKVMEIVMIRANVEEDRVATMA